PINTWRLVHYGFRGLGFFLAGIMLAVFLRAPSLCYLHLMILKMTLPMTTHSVSSLIRLAITCLLNPMLLLLQTKHT
ncbi:hypothetical protein MUP77_15095, partial [Candidatus Bathyarchaeota archaeon]|nr:hypothetical protein [Candidatus Bathyarchaeota archaeon]